MRFIFGDDWNDAPYSSRFYFLAMICICTRVIIIEYDVRSKYSEEYSTVDKVGSEKLLAKKSFL